MNFKEGDIISGGDIFGQVYENELIPEHNIMCPPNYKGTVCEMIFLFYFILFFHSIQLIFIPIS